MKDMERAGERSWEHGRDGSSSLRMHNEGGKHKQKCGMRSGGCYAHAGQKKKKDTKVLRLRLHGFYPGGHHSAYRCITPMTFASAHQWNPARLDSITQTAWSPVVTLSSQQLSKAQLGANLLLPSQLSASPAWLHDVLQISWLELAGWRSEREEASEEWRPDDLLFKDWKWSVFVWFDVLTPCVRMFMF